MLVQPATAGPNCTCRFAGNNYKTGTIMCIRGKLSKCDFVLNNTAWKTISNTCPQVRYPQSGRPGNTLASRLGFTYQLR